jgi:hypothetical protein
MKYAGIILNWEVYQRNLQCPIVTYFSSMCSERLNIIWNNLRTVGAILEFDPAASGMETRKFKELLRQAFLPRFYAGFRSSRLSHFLCCKTPGEDISKEMGGLYFKSLPRGLLEKIETFWLYQEPPKFKQDP